jgi:hypothetical protein
MTMTWGSPATFGWWATLVGGAGQNAQAPRAELGPLPSSL